MKTDDFIKALAADLPTAQPKLQSRVPLALLVSIPIALGLFFYAVHARPDFWTTLGDPRVLFKFAFSFTGVAAGLWLAQYLSRPGAHLDRVRLPLAITALVLAAGVGAELVMLPRAEWVSALVGEAALACVTLVPILGAAPLAAMLFALKAGAPDNPSVAGAAAGLASGAIGAALYAAHCTNDSPLFVAVWYVIGISALTVIGSLIGSRVLRW